MSSKDFHHTSHQLHQQSYKDSDIEKEISLYKNWFDNGSVDIWRHLRMLEVLHPFLENFKGAKWLTVGDGRFGTSAIYINKNGGDALPTDIDISLLKIAKENNMIPDYQYANAEALPFEDNSFDFSFCKESFHHFPRAYIALYEMLRVSRKAVILVEPRDWLPSPIPRRMLQIVKNIFRKILKKKIPHPDTGNYEPIGNYIFSISEREFQKIALGVNLPCVAFKQFHDVYFEGVEYEKADKNSSLLKNIKRKILFNEILFQIGIGGKNRIAAVIFKEPPDINLKTALNKIGFKIIELPKNPYIKGTSKISKHKHQKTNKFQIQKMKFQTNTVFTLFWSFVFWLLEII